RQNRTVYEDSFAEELADKIRIEVIKGGDTLIRQDDNSDDLFFILTGRVSIDVKGREVAVRTAGQHVGEMSVVDPAARRSATVTALEETAVAIIREPEFTELGDKYPKC